MSKSKSIYIVLIVVSLISANEISNATTIDYKIELTATVLELHSVFNGNAISDLSLIGGPFINWLNQQYLKMETQLWMKINYHLYENIVDIDMNIIRIYLFGMIRISYFIFLNGNFRENAIDLNLFDSYDEIVFDFISIINDSVRIANLTYLNDIQTFDDELRILLIVQDNFLLKKHLDDLHAFITNDMNYFMNVS